jgi:replicative DNA helicase
VKKKLFYPDVIFVDYAALMKATTRKISAYEELGSIFTDLRGWAGEEDVPILTGVQTNRGALEGMGTKSYIGQSFTAESNKINQICDVIMSIAETTFDAMQNQIHIVLSRSRDSKRDNGVMFDKEERTLRLTEKDVFNTFDYEAECRRIEKKREESKEESDTESYPSRRKGK